MVTTPIYFALATGRLEDRRKEIKESYERNEEQWPMTSAKIGTQARS